MTLRIFSDLNDLSSAATERILVLLKRAISERGEFHMALAGGTTPRQLYQRLSSPRFADHIPWDKIHLYFSDERSVPPDHPDSNYHMVYETLISRVPLREQNVHRIHGELTDTAEAARDYATILRSHLPKSPCGQVQFDLVLLGMGSDGHVASLFPNTAILQQWGALVDTVHVEKLATWRVSVTFQVIDNARNIMILVSGEQKANVIRQVFSDPPPNKLPVQMITPKGECEWYIDNAAAQLLPDSFR